MIYKEKIKFENKILKINLIFLIIMAISGIVLGSLSNSGAIKFDGIFSLFIFVTVIIGIVVNNTSLHKPSNKYPFGQYELGNIFTLLKIFSLLMLVLYSSLSATKNIIMYYNFDVKPDVLILKYSYMYYGLMLFVKSSSIFLYRYGKNTINDSFLMKEEYLSAIVDGLLTLSIFLGITIFSKITFISDIADELVLLLISLYLLWVLVKELIEIINIMIKKDIYIDKELSLVEVLQKEINEVNFKSCHFEKVGENYRITVICELNNNDITKENKDIYNLINSKYDHSIIEILWG